MSTHDAQAPSIWRILSLSVPSLGVLAAMPIYLLIDTAAVGRLGAGALASLGAAAAVYSVLTTQLTFLSYGTTARASAHFGAGRRDLAITEGVQATWVALMVGGALMTLLLLFATPIAVALTSDADVARGAAQWLRIAAVAIPLTLVEMAGNGWMRGIHDARKPLYFTLVGLIPGACAVPFAVRAWGLTGSAVVTVGGMGIIACCFAAQLWRSNKEIGGPWRPQWHIIRAQLRLGSHLIVRSLAFQCAFLSAAAVASRHNAHALAAHQIIIQLWNFLALVLDSLAIAAQALVGAALGAGQVRNAYSTGRKVTAFSVGFAIILVAVFMLGAHQIPQLFSTDGAVLAEIHSAWWVLMVMLLLGGVCFALDGVLLGASDAKFLRTLTVGSIVVGYVPGIIVTAVLGAGLRGIWLSLAAFIALRTVGVWLRFNSQAWASAAAVA